MSHVTVFWSNRQMKMPCDEVFRVNPELKILRNSKIVQKTAKLKCRQTFMPRKFLVLK